MRAFGLGLAGIRNDCGSALPGPSSGITSFVSTMSAIHELYSCTHAMLQK